VLGAGGFGEVVLARQTSLGRLVAIKRLHDHALAGPDALDRFRREAQVLARVNHPAVVRVFDFQRSDQGATLVMEYVDGTSLAGLLAAHPLTAPAALVVLRDVAAALQVAAGLDIVHRDIKPDNVFVLPDGHAKLGDFGLARALADPAVFRTSDGSVSGTPAYFPPELGQGTGQPDERSDAYSFAVMAYEVLTGRLPFDGAGAIALIAAHWTQEPPAPTEVVPGFPPAASVALLAGLHKLPEHRLLPHELVARLEAVPTSMWPAPAARTNGATGTVRCLPPVSPVVPVLAVGGGRRRRWLAAGALVALLSAAVGIATARWTADPDRGEVAEPLRVLGATVQTLPADGQTRCPTGAYVFAAEIATNGEAGTLRLHWTRPDSVRTPVVSLRVQAGQSRLPAELRFDVTGQRPLTGRAVLHLEAPEELTAVSVPVRYVC